MSDAQEDAVARLTRELNEAREALRPFAVAADHYSPHQQDMWVIARCLNIGDLRRARAVIRDA